MDKINVPELFGSLVFNDKVMRERLSDDIYNSLKKTIEENVRLETNVADAVAEEMKNWALENGATHFTHWFQPLTGVTAEKHDSFITPAPDGGVIMEFSGKELIKGEPDASSFPSGGLRATFEARGYTAWDPTSYAFIKDHTLCIPTAFCSFSGEALDKKTPLLRSMQAINRQAKRVLKLFGNEDVKYVRTSVGAEQEYFLIDKKVFDRRPDLKYTGRTLFGAMPPKGQEMDDHYFGVIKPRVSEFMEDLNQELWKLGILAKTEHNEVAPAQHELAPIYSTTNVATDSNQLTMEIMKKVANRHDMVCLLHEKPFAGVNGSGKHNNWSVATDTGVNLLSPGKTPYENAQFLLFLCAVIQAVDDYQDLLRLSVATAGNDHRLGANEAPPAIISIFLGDELSSILEAIKNDKPYEGTEDVIMKLGVHSLPRFSRDTTDRNRTSPFAFTGNKFEFRSLGSSNSIACCNIMLNAAVAESLRQYADELENSDNFEDDLHELIKRVITEHERILFDGNGYGEEWLKEATEVRGLSNLRTTADAMPHLLDQKNVDMLIRQKIFTEAEIQSRCEIMLENYVKTVNIEGLTMVDMVRKNYLPAMERYLYRLSQTTVLMRQVSSNVKCNYEVSTMERLSDLTDFIMDAVIDLEGALATFKTIDDIFKLSEFVRDEMLPKMETLRKYVDEAEMLTSQRDWPFPSYGQILFSVN
ncbi:glutamine synthetase [Lachnospiraceae bacterium]|nr:glutamine synthetase [Lachnospiraceae bacterium]